MDVSAPVLITGFVVSTIGFSVFLYGKKQQRLPQLVAGGLLMALPVLVPGAVALGIAALATSGGLWFAVRRGV